MTWSYRIGRFLGTELRVHVTFFLLLLWIGISAYLAEGPASAAFNVLFILALFLCVVLHELGHALMARRYGIKTPDITLLPIGGVARLERMPEDPVQEIWVALAGPAVNVVIWAVLVLILGAETGFVDFQNLDNAGADFITQLAAVNLMLVVFNMIPAFPMDGGRVFRAVLTLWLGRQKATAAAAGVGQAVAVVFALLGLLSGNLILLLVAFFVFAAATAENADVQMRLTAEGIEAREAMITSYEALLPHDGLAAMSSGLLRTTQHEFPVLDPEGRLQGFVTRDAIFHAVASEGRATAEAAMTGDIPSVGLRAPLGEVLDAMADGSAPAVAVCSPSGEFLGYITRENIGELMVLRRGRRG